MHMRAMLGVLPAAIPTTSAVTAYATDLRVSEPALAPVALLEAVERKHAAALQQCSFPGAVLAGAKSNVLALQARQHTR